MFVILVQTRTNAVGCQCATMRLKLRGDFLHRSFHIKGLRERLPKVLTYLVPPEEGLLSLLHRYLSPQTSQSSVPLLSNCTLGKHSTPNRPQLPHCTGPRWRALATNTFATSFAVSLSAMRNRKIAALRDPP